MQRFLFFLYFIFLIPASFGQEPEKIMVDGTSSHINLQTFSENLYREHQIRLIGKSTWLEKVYLPEITEEVPLINMLQVVLEDHRLMLKLFQNNLVIVPADLDSPDTLLSRESYQPIGNRLNKGRYSHAILSGQVIDGASGLPIPGAQVMVKALSLAVSTNNQGRYVIRLPAGPHQLNYSFIGLHDEQRKIIIYNDGKLDIELYEKSIALDEINIGVDKPDNNYRSPSMGIASLAGKTIKKLSVLMGEPDVMKGMLMLPGVQSVGENAAGFNVRGGTSDQNLILLNETPLFNPAHLFGLFSMLDAGLIKNVNLYKSSLPARYGSRLSSVMQINLEEGARDQQKTNGGIGLISSRLSTQGPLGKKASYLAGGRSTYSDWILRRLPEYELRQSAASFYDVHAKIDYNHDQNNRVGAMLYHSNDYFDYYQHARYEYGNLLASARWNHLYTQNQSGMLSATYSRYHSQLIDQSNLLESYQLNTGISQQQLAYHHAISSFARHHLNAGLSATHYLSEPGTSIPHGESSLARAVEISHESSFELSAYAEDEYELNPSLSLVAGARYSVFMLMGPDKINYYRSGWPRNSTTLTHTETHSKGEISAFYHGLDPRISLRYAFQNASSLKAAYTRTRQYLRQLSNSASITPADYWKTADTYLKPLTANQYSFGYFRNFNNNKIESSVEIYYKNIDQLNDFKDGALILLNPDIEQVLLSGKGRAYGLEFLFKKTTGKISGWLSYTWSRSLIKMQSSFAEEQINRGEWYPSNYDKPHDLSLVLNYQLSRRFTFASNFTYSTGRPATFPEEKYQIGNIDVVTYSDRNQYRLPDYHRLDMSLTYEGSLKRKQFWRSSWTFSVYNVYGRKNPFSVFYEKQNPSPKNNYQRYALYQFSIIGIPIPSFTYNFWF